MRQTRRREMLSLPPSGRNTGVLAGCRVGVLARTRIARSGILIVLGGPTRLRNPGIQRDNAESRLAMIFSKQAPYRLRPGADIGPHRREATMKKSTFPVRTFFTPFYPVVCSLIFAAIPGIFQTSAAHGQKPAPDPAPDVLVLSNGDTLHGKFVSETAGQVTFHSDPLGDISLSWDKIKEMHVSERFGVLNSEIKRGHRKGAGKIPVGSLDVADGAVTVHEENVPPVAPIPVKDAQYIMNETALNKQVYHQPSFFAAWNGSATAGATLVSATENQYTFNGAVNLVRAIPTVGWLPARDKTIFGFNESYGKITQPAYSYPPAPPATVLIAVPAVVTKSSITHFAGERDEYFSPRFFALGQAAFDHNYAQDLQLQQIYGGGFGLTVLKSPRQSFDLKGTVQYEKQQFIPGTGNVNQNLIGSTFAGSYALHLKLLTYTQALEFIPAYNVPKAYSATETDTVSFPTYKNFSFTVGTLDTYLNDAPFIGTASTPPTKPNSFQFTMGLTYAIKSKY